MSSARILPTRERVVSLLEAGLSCAAIARELGLNRSTVAYHVRNLGVPRDERAARRYDWSAIRAYYAAGHTVRECMRRFGFCSRTWHDAVRRGAVTPRPKAMPIEELITGRRNRSHVKQRLIAAGILEPRCARCGLVDWNDMPLSLCLHHVNGAAQDNRLENLQLLCPNCHSQTSNFSGRNRRARAPRRASIPPPAR